MGEVSAPFRAKRMSIGTLRRTSEIAAAFSLFALLHNLKE